MRFFILLVLGTALVAGGCKKKEKPVAKKEEPAPAEPAPIDDRNTAPVAGSSTLGGAYRAGKRALAQSDMDQLGKLIFATVLENDRMPSATDIKNSLKRDAPNLLAKIEEGVIVLTDTKNKDGLWAYEVDADRAGGIVLTGPTPNARRATADEVKQLLGNK